MYEATADAVRLLTRAGQWGAALALLHDQTDDAQRRRARADVLVDRDFWTGSNDAAPALDALAADDSWQARALRARQHFTVQLRDHIDGRATEATTLREQWRRLLADATDAATETLAHLYVGLTTEVLCSQPSEAARHYDVVATSGDDFLAAYALRHLGGQAEDRGDDAGARAMWRESLRLRQRCGHLTGALAQLQLVAATMSVPDLVDAWAAEIAATMLTTPALAGDS